MNKTYQTAEKINCLFSVVKEHRSAFPYSTFFQY